jgi:succinoglycan biosynthesis protein ExoA
MPEVSIVVPCYNEESTIQLLLGAIQAQTYPHEEIEVIIADGQSTDQTRERIADYQNDHPDMMIQIISNPERAIPAGLNKAIRAASGRWIVRLDAHSMPRQDYVERCIHALKNGAGDLVGGIWDIQPRSPDWQARSIALAAAHPLGVGDARYRFSSTAQLVETVPFGAFERSWVERIGYYDETLLTNEDYEFNHRIRKAGGRIWFDPMIRSFYFARANYAELARQYWRYGYWKLQMLRRNPESLRWRQALPPLFVLSIFLLLFLSPFLLIAGWLFVIESLIYVTVLFLAGIQMAWKHRDLALIMGLPAAIVTMHFSWGSAFLCGMISR